MAPKTENIFNGASYALNVKFTRYLYFPTDKFSEIMINADSFPRDMKYHYKIGLHLMLNISDQFLS